MLSSVTYRGMNRQIAKSLSLLRSNALAAHLVGLKQSTPSCTCWAMCTVLASALPGFTDFFHHSVSYFIHNALLNHDFRRFKIVLFSNVQRCDEKTARFRELVHEWHDISGSYRLGMQSACSCVADAWTLYNTKQHGLDVAMKDIWQDLWKVQIVLSDASRLFLDYNAEEAQEPQRTSGGQI